MIYGGLKIGVNWFHPLFFYYLLAAVMGSTVITFSGFPNQVGKYVV